MFPRPRRPSIAIQNSEVEESKRYENLIAKLNKYRIKIPSRSNAEDELSFLTDTEREESIKAEQAIVDHNECQIGISSCHSNSL